MPRAKPKASPLSWPPVRRSLCVLVTTLMLLPLMVMAENRSEQRRDQPTQETTKEQQKRLQALRDRIRELEQDLNQTRGERDNVNEDLQRVSREISTIVHDIRRLDYRLGTNKKRLQRLQQQFRTEKLKLQQNSEGLAQQVKLSYLLGRQQSLKMLLNQDNPARITRVLAYYRYFHQHRIQQIERTESRLSRLVVLQDDINDHQRELAETRAALRSNNETLNQRRDQRTALLTRLDRRIENQQQEIERLRADQMRLERLVQEIRTVIDDIPPLPSENLDPFGTQKGRLKLPTPGRISANYGESRRVGNLRWRGILLTGNEGQEITSVYRGRVAYAGWLRGFGLLLIMEHGDGYMTLYGHNQSLHKQVGEWVETGDVIASMGATGDTATPGLYFEIRHHGKPRDPLLWVRHRR